MRSLLFSRARHTCEDIPASYPVQRRASAHLPPPTRPPTSESLIRVIGDDSDVGPPSPALARMACWSCRAARAAPHGARSAELLKYSRPYVSLKGQALNRQETCGSRSTALPTARQPSLPSSRRQPGHLPHSCRSLAPPARRR